LVFGAHPNSRRAEDVVDGGAVEKYLSGDDVNAAKSQKGSFSLLRAIDDPAAQDRVRELVLQAYVADSQQVSDTVKATNSRRARTPSS
jgi:hypothetical protein